MEDDARRLGNRLAECATSVLGQEVVGVILHGSATTDDFSAQRSDIDVLAIVRDPIDDPAAAILTERVAAVGRESARNIDFRVVTAACAATPERLPQLELEIDVRIGREPDVRVETRRAPERDLVVEYSICRQHGIALVGPVPTELIGAVPTAWVTDVGSAQLVDWQALDFEPRHADLMVFTACRVWRFAAIGDHCSKTAAAEWVLSQDPELEVVRVALARRTHGSDGDLQEERIHALLAKVLTHLA